MVSGISCFFSDNLHSEIWNKDFFILIAVDYW